MLGGLLLVLAAITQLERPETHRAIGKAFGEPEPAAEQALTDRPPIVSPEVFREVRDNAPFRDDEQDAWFACLTAVQGEEPAALAGRSSGAVGYATLNSQPDAYRGRVVTVVGSVRRIESVEPAENDIRVDRLWRVTLQPTGGEVWPITVYTLEEPTPADEPYDASAVGVFFKKLSYRWADGVGSTPVVVAKRLETTLQTAVAPVAPGDQAVETETDFSAPGKGSLGRALLAGLGVEPSVLDPVVDRQPLLARETAAFYALLGAVEQTPPAQLVRLARVGLDDYAARHSGWADGTRREQMQLREIDQARERNRYSVVPLFDDGDRERGELIVIDAIIRRVVRIDASGSDAAKNSGVDHYYEVEAFSEDSQNLPIVFAMRDLPAGFPVGDHVRQPARLAGFFFKQWAYRTRKRTDDGDDRRQFAPLLIGRAPIPLAAPAETGVRPGRTIGVAATVGLVVIALAVWRLAREDRRHDAQTLSRLRAPESDRLDFGRLEDALAPSSNGADDL